VYPYYSLKSLLFPVSNLEARVYNFLYIFFGERRVKSAFSTGQGLIVKPFRKSVFFRGFSLSLVEPVLKFPDFFGTGQERICRKMASGTASSGESLYRLSLS
jgi:hypothetical protein